MVLELTRLTYGGFFFWLEERPPSLMDYIEHKTSIISNSRGSSIISSPPPSLSFQAILPL